MSSGSTGSARTRRVAARENSPVNRSRPRASLRAAMCSAIGRCLSVNSVVAKALGGFAHGPSQVGDVGERTMEEQMACFSIFRSALHVPSFVRVEHIIELHSRRPSISLGSMASAASGTPDVERQRHRVSC